MHRFLINLSLSFCLANTVYIVHGQSNYLDYHAEIIKCEQLIVDGKFNESIDRFNSLFQQFDFVFLRDCMVATELCAFEKDLQSGFRFMSLGIRSGWSLKSIKKNDNLNVFREYPKWTTVLEDYHSLRNVYLERLNGPLMDKIQEMYKKDQKKALGALFRIGHNAKVKYAENKFAPHSKKQLAEIEKVLDEYGYPGEKHIGNNWKTSVILSHHNSISVPYNSQDTLYAHLKPKLLAALAAGEISPYELAVIEDWKTAVLNGHQLTSYGFLGSIPNNSVLAIVNKNRAAIGMRSIELRNKLIDIEEKTGMDLYLPKDWRKEKIMVGD